MKRTTNILYEIFAKRIFSLRAPESSRIAVALSGGPDSRALALIAALYAERRLTTRQTKSNRKEGQTESLSEESRPLHLQIHNFLKEREQVSARAQDHTAGSSHKVLALIVDHRLRPESKEEALKAFHFAESIGLQPSVLTIDWKQTSSDIQNSRRLMEKARIARYKRLHETCLQEGTRLLLVSHHADDEVEGFLMRLFRGSGIEGLAGMSEVSVLHHSHWPGDDIVLFRPFLGLRKQALIECLNENNVDWCSDPSNSNDAFFRVRIRDFMEDLFQFHAIDQKVFCRDILRLVQVCKKIKKEQEERSWQLFAKSLVDYRLETTAPFNPVCIDLNACRLAGESQETVKRLLVAIALLLRPALHPPTGKALTALVRATTNGYLGRRFQVGGCLLTEMVQSPSRRILRITPQASVDTPTKAKKDMEV